MNLVAVVILTVHDVRTPWEKANILRYLLELFGLAVDDNDGVFGRIRKIDFLILRVGRSRLEVNIHTNLDTSRWPESIHIVDIHETASRADYERFPGSEIHTGHIFSCFQCRRDFVRF